MRFSNTAVLTCLSALGLASAQPIASPADGAVPDTYDYSPRTSEQCVLVAKASAEPISDGVFGWDWNTLRAYCKEGSGANSKNIKTDPSQPPSMAGETLVYDEAGFQGLVLGDFGSSKDTHTVQPKMLWSAKNREG